MKFSRGTSYNTHDVSVSVGKRISVKFNVRKRCDLFMNAVLRYGAEGASITTITDHINTRLGCAYSESDMRYAAKRLMKDGFVTSPKRDHFVATPRALEAWKKAPKEWIGKKK
ncbi:MAG TPA: hypothetical protein PLE74_07590 [Candidatus Cloacimonadota bacterium]|nr:hypothetical protein [Candidatus Cloacimonadota bacterium]